MSKPKKSGWMPIQLEVIGSDDHHIITSDWDYFWIGSRSMGGPCFGVVKDKDVERLRDRCNEILAGRTPKKRRGTNMPEPSARSPDGKEKTTPQEKITKAFMDHILEECEKSILQLTEIAYKEGFDKAMAKKRHKMSAKK